MQLAKSLLLACLLTSGCYTSTAVVDLVRRHPPSDVSVDRYDSAAAMTVRIKHGSPPSDTRITRVMPDLYRRTTSEIVLPAGTARDACSRFMVTFVSPLDGRVERTVDLRRDRRLYAAGPFPLKLAPDPERTSTEPATCWIAATYPATDGWNPSPESLIIYDTSGQIEVVPLPVEWGASSWRRWLWLVVAPAVDASGFVIVPAEWIGTAIWKN